MPNPRTGSDRHDARAARPVVSAGSARSLLLTVLGDFAYPNRRPVWTSSLLYVLQGVGIEGQTARQAIARGAAAGWMAPERHGREVRWQLAPAGIALIEEGLERVASLSAEPPPWDGNWLVLMVTVPHSARAVRKKLYGPLRYAGFGNPTPGVWLSPHVERAAEAKRIVERLGLASSTLSFIGSSAAVGLSDREIVEQAWDLDEVIGRYEAALARFRDVEPGPGDPVLFTHVQLANELQRFPFIDPQLPEALLPEWIGREAARLFIRLRGEWWDAAHRRWREVVEEPAPVG